MEIKKATFVVSNSDYRKCPDTGLPEYAFIGRSNVGKSSLINMLTNNKGLAKTSIKPGKTQLINHFLINNEWYLVDLPGYGYARTSKESRAKWQKMITDYMPQQIDIDFINFLGGNGIPLTIVYTKTDKQKQKEIAATVNKMKQVLHETWEELPTILMTSSVTKSGRDHLLNHIDEINKQLKNPNSQDDNHT